MKEIPLALPCMDEAEIRAVSEVINSGWVTQGPKVKSFEEAFAAAVGARHACAVSSCTAALHLALMAVGVRPGDVVITVSHSFIATANAVRYCQAEPVFVDIDPNTLNMDAGALSQCLRDEFELRDGGLWYREVARLMTEQCPLRGRAGPTGRLAAIQVVHQVGMPADLDRILSLAREHGVPVVEDAACATGSEINMGKSGWERIGKPHGDIACFSFHPRKVITTGDGGMLTTNIAAYDEAFRLLRQHGMGLSDYTRHRSAEVIFEQYLTTGFNYRMTDIQAALGLEQLKRLPGLITQRRDIAAAYGEQLSGVRGISCLQELAYARSNWQSYVIHIDDDLDQKWVMQRLKERGISSRRGVMCAHLEAPYAGAWPKGCLPNSEAAQTHGIVLPLYPGMGQAEVKQVVDGLKSLLTQ